MNSYFMRQANLGMAQLSQADGLPFIFRNHHIGQFDHPLGNVIKELYPGSVLFAENDMAWYSRIPTHHAGVRQGPFVHATSPLRRSPDLINHVNRSAVLNGEEPPFDEAYLDDFVRELADKLIVRRNLGALSLAGETEVA
jgi:exoribonuclease R